MLVGLRSVVGSLADSQTAHHHIDLAAASCLPPAAPLTSTYVRSVWESSFASLTLFIYLKSGGVFTYNLNKKNIYLYLLIIIMPPLKRKRVTPPQDFSFTLDIALLLSRRGKEDRTPGQTDRGKFLEIV